MSEQPWGHKGIMQCPSCGGAGKEADINASGFLHAMPSVTLNHQWIDKGNALAYPGKWVALHAGNFIAAADTLREAVAALEATKAPIMETCVFQVGTEESPDCQECKTAQEWVDCMRKKYPEARLRIPARFMRPAQDASYLGISIDDYSLILDAEVWARRINEKTMHTERQIAIFAVAASRGDQDAAQKLVTLLQAAGALL